jgi:type IV secretory pathway ATPase VirB11/archaellum biosynthesis ATPase
MLTLTGTVLTVIRHNAKQMQDGTTRGAYSQVQLLARETLQDGQERMSVQTMSTDSPDAFDAFTGREISVPVGAFPKGNVLAFFMRAGALPSLAATSSAPSLASVA